jgi:hypothetical protein
VPAQDEVREAFDMKVLPKTVLSMLKLPHVIGTGVAQ